MRFHTEREAEKQRQQSLQAEQETQGPIVIEDKSRQKDSGEDKATNLDGEQTLPECTNSEPAIDPGNTCDNKPSREEQDG